MKVLFNDAKLESLFIDPIEELGKQKFSRDLIRHYRNKIRMMMYADRLEDIAKISGLNLEKLNGAKYKECYSIRINDQFRLIFKKLKNGGIELLILELSKHYE